MHYTLANNEENDGNDGNDGNSHTRLIQRRYNHHQRKLCKRLHANNGIAVRNRKSLINAAIFGRHKLKLLNHITNLFEAVGVEREGVLAIGQNQECIALKQNQLVTLGERGE